MNTSKKIVLLVIILSIYLTNSNAQLNHTYKEFTKFLIENNIEYTEGIADDGKKYITYFDDTFNEKYFKGCYFENDICIQWVMCMPKSNINNIIRRFNETFVKLKYHLTWKDYEKNILYRIDNESDRAYKDAFVLICTNDDSNEH